MSRKNAGKMINGKAIDRVMRAVILGCLSFFRNQEGEQNGKTIKISPLCGGSKQGEGTGQCSAEGCREVWLSQFCSEAIKGAEGAGCAGDCG
jgi:hypothetical protein